MRQIKMNRFVVAGLAATLLFGAVACGSSGSKGGGTSGSTSGGSGSSSSEAVKSLDDLTGKTIGVQTGTTGETYANENKPEGAKIKSFEDTTGLFGALESGDIDAVLQDLPVNAGRVAEDDTVSVIETFKTDEQYGFAVEKGNALKDDLDKALAAVRDDGTYDALYEKYFPTDGAEPGPGPDASDVKGGETLKVCSDIPYPPMEFEGEGPRGLQYTGFDIELLDAMAVSMDMKLEILDVGFDGILGNLASGTCDVVGSSLTITEERKQEVDFTEPYFDADQSLLVKVG